MLPGIFLFAFGLLLIVWGIYRLKHDFSQHKTYNNFFQMILTGQASGVGRVILGLLTVIVGIIVIFMNK